MLQTRLWMGAVLIVLAAGMLIVDQWLAPWFPFMFVFVLCLSLAACAEVTHLLGPSRPPHPLVCYGGIVVLVLANWLPHVRATMSHVAVTGQAPELAVGDPWRLLLGVFTAIMLLTILAEMASFREPGASV